MSRRTGRCASRLDAASPARLAGVAESEVAAVFHGAAPDGILLRRLSRPQGVHVADLFTAAGVAVPDGLAALDASAGWSVPRPVRHAPALAPEQRAAGGGAPVRMARNRNLSRSATARTFLLPTGRYQGVSAQ
ncbi:hypothetical protein [Streptomyces sp. IGB124]|uniref:hypothetical protein n=1 Tax=Streptomyces sp. IGB124 TaxID=1519485 RepID=UPI00131C9938|nr:hypothetical protein [Streptomyces sp. IGB124]